MDTCSIYLTIQRFFAGGGGGNGGLACMHSTHIESVCGSDGGGGVSNRNQYRWHVQNFKLASIVNVI